VWYEIRSRINNREPLFRLHKALTIFAKVFHETGLRFAFKICGLRLEGDLMTFYIKPEDGLKLPEIMKWMKQVFAQKYNAADGRTGHIWGDRYWSRIVEGEPDGEKSTAPGKRTDMGVRPWYEGTVGGISFSLLLSQFPAPSPG
jgi:REP element-mobilizing transposase RayT